MSLSWRQRLQLQPALWHFQHWPRIPLDTLPAHTRKAFLRNQQVIAHALGGRSLAEIAQQFNLSTGRVSQLLNRVLGGQAASEPALTAGLIPFASIQAKTRQQPFSTLAKKSGSNCAFQALLDHVPGLRDALDTMILAKLKDADYAQRLTPQAFHGEFKRVLAETHWPTDRYPYTHASLAYESVRRYLHQRTDALLKARQIKKQTKPRDFGLKTNHFRALRAIQIDEHKLDLRNRIHLQLNDELIPLPIARASVLVARDVDTMSVLGYHLAPTVAPNQQDMLTLLDHCISPWQPLEMKTPGLSYTPGACFPSGLADAFPISFGAVQMDNALMHRAHSVINFLCEQYGATLHLGPPAMPKMRQLVESVFDYITEHCSKRVASTTGTHPKDPIRESRKNKKRVPPITFQTVNEAFSVLFTEYNITPTAALGGVSPLELFEHQCRTRYIRYVPTFLSQQWQPLLSSKEVPLHWYKQQRRVPHINFYFARYKGTGLYAVADTEKRIRVVFDRRDIRTLHAYTLSGKDLGMLEVASSWRRFPHTLATRQWIHKNAQQYHLNMRDPLSSYFRLLLENRGKPSEALSLLRVYTEFSCDQSSNAGLICGTDEETTDDMNNRTKHKIKTPRWHREMANYRR